MSDDRRRVSLFFEGLHGVVAHRGVPRALRREHPFPVVLAHPGRVEAVVVEGSLEQPQMLRAVRVDLRRNMAFSSSVRPSKPFLRTAATTSRGVLTANIRRRHSREGILFGLGLSPRIV